MAHKSHTREDESYMRLAIAAALPRLGKTGENPTVGAAIIRKGKVLSVAHHRGAGKPHAEIEAIRALADHGLTRGATLYVTLEPCSTSGRTPPCTEAIIKYGFRRVVIGARDPNPRHCGRGVNILRRAGIAVVTDVLERECGELNRAWNKWISTGVPYVTAKFGMSLDGRIASPPGMRWITSAASRADAMSLRAETDAILVGAETVRIDDPNLTLRGRWGRKQTPLRVIWSTKGRVPVRSKVLTDAHRDRTLVYQGVSLPKLLADLGGRGVQSVLIEGGGRTLGEAFDRGLVDRMVAYVAPVLTGGSVPAIAGAGLFSNESRVRLENLSYRELGGDLRIEGIVKK